MKDNLKLVSLQLKCYIQNDSKEEYDLGDTGQNAHFEAQNHIPALPSERALKKG
jgi:hypothetical protein